MKNELGIPIECENCQWHIGKLPCNGENCENFKGFKVSHKALEDQIKKLQAKLNCPDIGDFMRAIVFATQIREMNKYPRHKGVLLKALGFFSALKHDREYVSAVEAELKAKRDKYEAFMGAISKIDLDDVSFGGPRVCYSDDLDFTPTISAHNLIEGWQCEARELLEGEGI